MLVVEFGTDAQQADSEQQWFGALGLVTALLDSDEVDKWLAKDVLLVAVERVGQPHERWAAFGQWMREYMDGSAQVRHAGTLLAAVVLDVPPGVSFRKLTMTVAGHHGLLPNLDVVSTASMLVKRFLSSRPSVADTFPASHWLSTGASPRWLKPYRPLLRFVAHSVLGLSTGYHGYLLDYDVDTIALSAKPGTSKDALRTQFRTALAMEALLRSLNNLIEKLHHSTFLYMLVGKGRFVSMGKYLPAFVLLLAPLPLTALLAYFNLASGTRTFPYAESAAGVFGAFVAGAAIVFGVPAMVGQGEAWLVAGLVLAVVSAIMLSRGPLASPRNAESAVAAAQLVCSCVLFPVAIIHFPVAVGCVLLVLLLLLPATAPARVSCLGKIVHTLCLCLASPAAVLTALEAAELYPGGARGLLADLSWTSPRLFMLTALAGCLYIPMLVLSLSVLVRPSARQERVKQE